MQWQNATIVDIVARSKSVSSFFFKLPQRFDFEAGQHVVVRLTAPDGYTAQRSYSIASAPDKSDIIELAIERLDDGEVSPFFHDVAEVGDEIELRGPIGGHFVWRGGDGGAILLIGAGSGVVPLLSMARQRATLGDQTPMALLLSVRTHADLLYGEELQALAARNDGFTLTVTYTREKVVGALSRRVDAEMIVQAMSALPTRAARVYICGSNSFCDVAVDGALASGIAAEAIRTERYGV